MRNHQLYTTKSSMQPAKIIAITQRKANFAWRIRWFWKSKMAKTSITLFWHSSFFCQRIIEKKKVSVLEANQIYNDFSPFLIFRITLILHKNIGEKNLGPILFFPKKDGRSFRQLQLTCLEPIRGMIRFFFLHIL